MATMPVTGYCTFHTTRESKGAASGTRRVWRPGVGPLAGTGAILGETLVRLGSPDASSRRCIASRRPPFEPDAAMRRAAAVPPIRGPGWHSLAGPTGSLFFASRYLLTGRHAPQQPVAEARR